MVLLVLVLVIIYFIMPSVNGVLFCSLHIPIYHEQAATIGLAK